MNAAKTNPPVASRPEDDEIDWRSALVLRLRFVIVVFILLAGIATWVGRRSELMGAFGIAVIILSVLLIGILWSPKISARIKSVIMIAGLSAISIMAYITSAFLPGGAMTAMFALVLTALLIGRVAFVWLLVAFTLLAVGQTIAVSAGWWTGPALVDIDPSDPVTWLRVTLIGSLLWASLGFSVLFVVDTIERHLSQRRAALDSLKKENAERRNAERARREAEAIASQAQKLEAVGQLAAGVAHDFNNALLVIQGWNEIRGEADIDEMQREATAAIQQAVDRTAQLSKQLLTFARKEVRTPKYFYLDRLVEQTAKTMQNLVGARIQVRTELERDRVIYADEMQAQQMLINLVLNARDAIDDAGNIRVAVRAAGRDEVDRLESTTRDWVMLEVEDDGHGMDDETRARIFEPFFTTKKSGLGSGLGLATVFGIVKQNGGHIGVSSKPGHTVFSVCFPSVSVNHIEAPAEAQIVEDVDLDLRVLVLEDDPFARQILVTILKKNGCEVVECADGDDALSLLSVDRQAFDMLCSDAVFPGAELGAVVEEFEKHSPAAKVMICSGYVQQDLAMEKLESGEYGFLAKPFTAARLVRKIREIVPATEMSD